jgi:hypothetical protein
MAIPLLRGLEPFTGYFMQNFTIAEGDIYLTELRRVFMHADDFANIGYSVAQAYRATILPLDQASKLKPHRLLPILLIRFSQMRF